MLLKCIVFNGDAVFETPAFARRDRNAQFSESQHITVVRASCGPCLGPALRGSIELAPGTDEESYESTTCVDDIQKQTLQALSW